MCIYSIYGDPNPDSEALQFEWVEGRPEVGLMHFEQHGVSKSDIEEAILRVPPEVEVKRDSEKPDRIFFYGATRFDRWIFVVCSERFDGDVRVLTPITAYEPDDGRAYWEGL